METNSFNPALKGEKLNDFDYERAFSRNLGWLTQNEQNIIKQKRIAIAGLGGVGGSHLISFVRTGFSNFKIADFDEFSVENFNRQTASNMNSIGVAKIDILKDEAKLINPDCSIECFTEGINPQNINEFLNGVDILVDGLDVFELDLRVTLFERAHQLGVPVVTAGPFGAGTALMAFNPKGMSFNQYFDIQPGQSLEKKLIHFLVGMTPKFIHLNYLADDTRVDFNRKMVPSLNIGCSSASSALIAFTIKYFLNRGKIKWAPSSFQTDFFQNQWRNSWRPFGNKNPIQKILIWLVNKRLQRKSNTK